MGWGGVGGVGGCYDQLCCPASPKLLLGLDLGLGCDNFVSTLSHFDIVKGVQCGQGEITNKQLSVLPMITMINTREIKCSL